MYRADDAAIIAPQHPDLIARYCQLVEGDMMSMLHGIVPIARTVGAVLDGFPNILSAPNIDEADRMVDIHISLSGHQGDVNRPTENKVVRIGGTIRIRIRTRI